MRKNLRDVAQAPKMCALSNDGKARRTVLRSTMVCTLSLRNDGDSSRTGLLDDSPLDLFLSVSRFHLPVLVQATFIMVGHSLHRTLAVESCSSV